MFLPYYLYNTIFYCNAVRYFTGDYIMDMKKYKDLSKKTELELIHKIQTSNSPDIYIEELLSYFEEKIILYINKYKKIYSEDDIRGTYTTVFWKCVKKFDIGRNNRLNTFVEKNLIYELARECKSDNVPEIKHKLIREMQSIINNSTNSTPPDIEIADKMGLPLQKVIELKNSLYTSLDKSIAESPEKELNKDLGYLKATLSPEELTNYILSYNNPDDDFFILENSILEKIEWTKEELRNAIEQGLSSFE